MNAYYFREDKTAVLDAIKAQLPFSEGKYQLLISFEFSATASEQIIQC